MRQDTCSTFWVKTSREERDEMRAVAKSPPEELSVLIRQIKTEDKSRTRDFFWRYRADECAAENPDLYKKVTQDILVVVDCDQTILLCKFKNLFQLLYGPQTMHKVESAVRQWNSLTPLPIPDTRRHMVDTLIREKYPEQDLEKARTVEEVEQRHQCVVHYGT